MTSTRRRPPSCFLSVPSLLCSLLVPAVALRVASRPARPTRSPSSPRTTRLSPALPVADGLARCSSLFSLSIATPRQFWQPACPTRSRSRPTTRPSVLRPRQARGQAGRDAQGETWKAVVALCPFDCGAFCSALRPRSIAGFDGGEGGRLRGPAVRAQRPAPGSARLPHSWPGRVGHPAWSRTADLSRNCQRAVRARVEAGPPEPAARPFRPRRLITAPSRG